MDEFKLSDLNNPLYEHSQVVTVHDLQTIYRGLAVQYDATKWWEFKRRYAIAVAGGTVYEILGWLHDGKPTMIGGRKNEVAK